LKRFCGINIVRRSFTKLICRTSVHGQPIIGTATGLASGKVRASYRGNRVHEGKSPFAEGTFDSEHSSCLWDVWNNPKSSRFLPELWHHDTHLNEEAQSLRWRLYRVPLLFPNDVVAITADKRSSNTSVFITLRCEPRVPLSLCRESIAFGINSWCSVIHRGMGPQSCH